MGSVLVTVAMLSRASKAIQVVIAAASDIPNLSGARREAR